MSRYLTFERYDGTLSGLRENPPGPEDLASPGGLATIQHHWTGGLGGVGDTTPDVFAGTGDRYVAGEYGNLYVPESHAAVHSVYRGPDTDRTESQTLSGKQYYFQRPKPTPKAQPKASPDQTTEKKSFELVEGFEEVETDTSSETVLDSQPSKSKTVSSIVLLIILLVAFVTFDFWSSSVQSFISQKFHGGKKIGWPNYVGYSVVLTLVLFVMLYVSEIPLRSIESADFATM